MSDIAFDATLRAAAPYQKARHLLNKDLAFVIKSRDLRDKVRENVRDMSFYSLLMPADQWVLKSG